MAIAETAELVARLRLQDQMTGPTQSARGAMRGLDSDVSRTSSRVSAFSRVGAGAANSMSHFRGKLSGAAQSMGLLGLGGAVLLTTKFLKDSMGDAVLFGETVDKLTTLTGMAVGETSKFSDALGYFGIAASKQQSIIGLYMKSVDALTSSKKNAAKFEEQYGFSLRDSTGHVKDAQEVISSFVDYFNNKTIPMQTRAAAGAKLFGRGWQELLPIFQAGGKEWHKQLAAGMELTPENIKQLHKMRDAQREWNDTLGDFKVVVGLQLLPVFTDLAKKASEFLSDPNNQKTLLGFLATGIKLGQDLATFIGGSVIPQVSSLAGAAKGFWDSIPGPLRDLLIQGAVADRAVKFLFGFSLSGVATDVIGGAIKTGLSGIFGQFFSRGASPANPLFVSALGGVGGAAGAGGVAGGAARGAGIGGRLVQAVSLMAIAGSALMVYEQLQATMAQIGEAQKILGEKAAAAINQSGQEASQNIAGLVNRLKSLNIFESAGVNTFGSAETGRALINMSKAIVQDQGMSRQQITDAIANLQVAQTEATNRGWTEAAESIGADIGKLTAKLPTAPEIAAAVKPKPAEVAEPDAALPTGKPIRVRADPRASADIGAAISTRLRPMFGTLGSKMDTLRTTVSSRMSLLMSMERVNAARLYSGIQQDMRAVNALRAAVTAGSFKEAALLGMLVRKPTSFTAVTNVNVSTYVSARDVTSRQAISNRYGPS